MRCVLLLVPRLVGSMYRLWSPSMIDRLARRWPLTCWWLLGLALLTLLWQPYYFDTLLERILWATDRVWGFWHLVPRLAVDPVVGERGLATIAVQAIASAFGLVMVVALDVLLMRWIVRWRATRATVTTTA
jgi:hypothetical protein